MGSVPGLDAMQREGCARSVERRIEGSTAGAWPADGNPGMLSRRLGLGGWRRGPDCDTDRRRDLSE